ncbi:MAG: hypothetical protein QMB11_07315 [Nonlabens sp.]|jgi:hypothetical protein|uniref:carboxypeptidase-like regulatory domain-containing protein n=1 Tax=Nonlabens sp. TaxID=1888209 RepID=UPI0035A5FFA3
MKKLLLLFLFFSSLFLSSQEIKRENVNGKIIVEGIDIEGITIYNTSSKKGTTTNEIGEFTIAVTVNDLIQIRALEYQNFDFTVNKRTTERKKISIYLIEEVEKLAEVLVSTRILTGNIKNDVDAVKNLNLKSNALYFKIKDKDAIDFGSENKNQIKEIGIQSNAISMVTGLNLTSVVDQLLIPLFRSEVKDKKLFGVPEVPTKSIKYYLGSTFLVENYNIPENRVEEFIRYVENKGFDFNLLNYGNEMQFLELLSTKSKIFLESKTSKD